MAEVTVRALLQRPDLRLQLIGAAKEGARLLDRPLRWGYSTDLLDPTPFLRGEELILTTGQQLWGADDAAELSGEYVQRLADAGAAGLVYTLEQPRSAWAAGLRAACEQVGLPLIEAPFSTPFISISEAISAGRNDPEREGMRRVLHAHHALTLAALERNPAQALVRELSVLLGCAVWLWEGSGRPKLAAPSDAPPEWVERVVVERMGQRRSRRQAGVETRGASRLLVHSLRTGDYGESVGVLGLFWNAAAMRVRPRDVAADRDERMIVNSAVAMLQLSLGGREESAQTTSVGALAARALLDDELLTGAELLRRALPQLDAAQLQRARWLMVCAEGEPIVSQSKAVAAPAADPGRWAALVAIDDDDTADAALRRVSGRHRAVSVLLPPIERWRGDIMSTAFASLRRHLASGLGPRLEQIDPARIAVLSALCADPDAAAELRRLQQAAHAAEGTGRELALVKTFLVWSSAMYSWQQTATALGVHRNTVVRRVRALSRYLGRDLERDAEACRMLWLALAAEASPAQASGSSANESPAL